MQLLVGVCTCMRVQMVTAVWHPIRRIIAGRLGGRERKTCELRTGDNPAPWNKENQSILQLSSDNPRRFRIGTQVRTRLRI